MKLLPDERSHIGFDLPCILFAPNYTNQEIVRIADINNPLYSVSMGRCKG